MKKVLIIGSSKQPIPAVKGGAVPVLVEELIAENEKRKKMELSCVAFYDEEAEREALKYQQTRFIWAKPPKIVKDIDKICYLFAKYLLKGKRLHSLSFLAQIIWFIFFIAKVLRKDTYDAIIFENSLPELYALKLYGNKNKYRHKWYLHMHTVPRGYYGTAKLLLDCQKIIVVSNYVKGKIQGATKFPDDKFVTMYNCLKDCFFEKQNQSDLEMFKAQLSSKLIDKNHKVILFAGRLNAEKGIEKVIEAIHLLQTLNIVLLVVGSNFYKTTIKGPYEQRLQELSCDLQDKIIFTGYIDYNEMPKVYGIADIVVLPSIWEEPAGMTMIEAMACNRPLITTNSGGIPEYVGKGGCILLERDIELVRNIAKEIDGILTDKNKGTRLAIKGKNNVAHLNQQYYYAQFEEIMRQ